MPNSIPARPLKAFALAIATVALLLVHSAGPVRAAEFTDAQKAEMGTVIRDYLLKNPEVLQDAMTELDRRQKAEEATRRQQAVETKSSELFHSVNGATIGNPQGKVTLVEFFDYNCGYCKRALDDVGKLLKTEPELRLVLKDFPVLGPGSVEAAQIAGAVRNQLKGDAFWQFHYKLLSTHGPVGKAQALAAAKDSGVNMDQLAKDVGNAQLRTGLQQTMQLADALSLTGTPSFVIGQDVVVGAVGYDELKDKIDNVLKCGKAMCS
jgi:protein-disulfide isomerase